MRLLPSRRPKQTGDEAPHSSDSLLTVSDLEVEIRRHGTPLLPVRGVSFSVVRGRTLGIIGESGSGKTMTGLAIMRLLPKVARIRSGLIRVRGTDVTTLSESEMCKIRGQLVSMVYQDPMSSLNPLRTIGYQLTEAMLTHLTIPRVEAVEAALTLLEEVGIANPEKRSQMFPHEFSGGMLQRVVIAMAMACNPDIVIADEPTSALDVTTQVRVMDRFSRLTADHGTTVILITHDLALATAFCDEIQVMYGGRIVERADAQSLREHPIHPYSEALVNSVCSLDSDVDQPLSAIRGQPASPSEIPPGCSFHPRCPYAFAKCKSVDPMLLRVGGLDRLAACHLAEERAAAIR